MKKTLITIGLLLSIIAPALALADIALAQTTTPPAPATPQDVSGQINNIFQIQTLPGGSQKGLEQVKNLSQTVTSAKETTFSDVFASIAKIFTGVAVVMTFVGLFIAGVMLVITPISEQQTEKAKTIIIYVVIGDIIIAASYAIIKGITLLQPFQ